MASILPTGSSSVATRVRPRQERAWSIVGSVIASSSAASSVDPKGLVAGQATPNIQEPRLTREAAANPPDCVGGRSGERGSAAGRHGDLDVAGEPVGLG